MTTPRTHLVSAAGLQLEADRYEHWGGDHVYLGDDWQELIAACRPYHGGRHLDVGTGSGIVLLVCAKHHTHSVGMDINPRAVAMARANAQRNGIVAEFHHADIFTTCFEPFDLVTWNMPFMFVPDSQRDWWAGYGGHLGIELTLKFLERLPALLTPNGHAVLESASPILEDGTDVLARELQALLTRVPLNVRVTPSKAYWDHWHRDLHRQYSIRSFMRLILVVTHGSGLLTHMPPTLTQRVLNRLRQWRHERR
jgi:methylase of polypeptide subunit release factors